MKKLAVLLVVILAANLLSACTPRSTVGVIGGADGPTSVIVSRESDTPAITSEEAVLIALSHAGLTPDQVHAHAPELELDDGVLRYEVEFHNAAASYSYEINAVTGEILSFEKDN